MKLPALLLACAALYGQERAQLVGVIRDATGAPVPDTGVSVYNVDIGVRRTARTDDQGFYAVSSLHAGSYKITVRRPGFRTIARTGIVLGATERGRADFLLEIGAAHEEITVHGAADRVNTNDAASLLVVNRDPFETLPLNHRGVQASTEFAPGLVLTPATRGEAGQFTANGQRPNTNYFTVDGVSVNNGITGSGLPGEFSAGALPGMTAIGSLHGLVSTLEVEEVRVQTSTFAPEFGRLPGAHVAVVTRSGSNDFHGEFFGSIRPRRLGATGTFAKRSGVEDVASAARSAGGSVAGPLMRNRSFFSAGTEWLGLRQAAAWRIAVPSSEARRSAPPIARAVLDAFPVPHDPIHGFAAAHTAVTDWPGRVARGSLRLDHAIAPNALAFFRYSRTDSASTAGYVQANEAHFRSHGLTFGLLNSFGSSFTSDARIGMAGASVESSWRPAALGGAQPLDIGSIVSPGAVGARSVLALSIPGFGQFLSAERARSHQSHWNLMETVAWSAGTHQFRFGIDYQRLGPKRDRAISGMTGTYASLADVLAGATPAVHQLEAPAGSSVIETFSAFAQDAWRATPRLNVTYGVRWEVTPPPSYRGLERGLPMPGIASPTLPREYFLPEGAASTAVWKTRYTQFAPRVGAAYRLTEDGATVIRAGTGIFYDTGFSSVTDVLNGAPFNRWVVALAGVLPSATPPPVVYGYASGLKLPWSAHWNVTVERMLAGETVLSAGYVGSMGRRLLRLEGFPATSTNPSQIVLAGNQGSSSYHSLQVQARRSLARGLRGFAAYTWGHSIDNGSWNSAAFLVFPGATDRGPSDFDVRHSFVAGFAYDLPGIRAIRGWSLSGIVRSRTGFPIDVLQSENPFGLAFDNQRPDFRPDVPMWLDDPGVPGGRRLNREAFPSAVRGRQGALGRNPIRGFGLTQVDLSLQRRFAIGERASASLRLEAYNVANRAFFADPVRFLSSPLFGQSVSHTNLLLGTGRAHSGLSPALQAGGPRSVQIRVDLRF